MGSSKDRKIKSYGFLIFIIKYKIFICFFKIKIVKGYDFVLLLECRYIKFNFLEFNIRKEGKL